MRWLLFHIVAIQLSLVAGLLLDQRNSSLKVVAEQKNDRLQCVKLKNVQGTHYTIAVSVGTPPQSFDVVADTGSSWVIIESCKCKKAGFCEASNKCFDHGQSQSLKISSGRKGDQKVILYFGSGPIESMIGTDFVQMGEANVTMKNGVLLMVDQMLNFEGPFEGILGLGIPSDKATFVASTVEKRLLQIPPIYKGLPLGNGTSLKNKERCSKSITQQSSFCKKKKSLHHMRPPYFADGFLEKAGITRFSICYSDNGWEGDSGMLRMNIPQSNDRYRITSNTVHWQLGLQGIFVGDSETPTACNPKSKSSRARTACGAIMDSGTTYILGPEQQVASIFEDLCERWPRCKQNHTAMVMAAEQARNVIKTTYHVDRWEITAMSKQDVFRLLVQDCNAWYDDKVGFTEIPDLRFKIVDNKKEKMLHFDPWTFILSKKEPEVNIVRKNIPGYGEVPVGDKPTGRMAWVCTPAFGAMNYPSTSNGPSWVIGLPLYFNYQVQYDISTKPPSISFNDEPCGHCDKVENLAKKREARGAVRPRKVTGEPRDPTFTYEVSGSD